ncbi:universal stress protein [Streptosporangium sp. NBC_01755]|uniref:universal stress protein n=1 Tax=unclassified Streptosporangium TaxID=2632669 RepID=UPI002DD9E0F1|nr:MULTISPECIES: universal stress protein [unclassified Streptosporangium]WSA28708.1 universal stress protein [Streptosporangium sp. NBC_01810]WSC99839.1 universal stress protein [Streptosporangium sp. NBC_01755]
MILVGVDGSQAALEAVSWAVREARLRGAELRVVHAMVAWPLEMTEDAPYADVGRWMRDGAMSMLTDALDRAREKDGRVKVEPLLLPGDPRDVLIEAAKDADLLVVGSHGRDGFSGMLLGSVALGVTGHSACPVAVIRKAPERSHAGVGEVVVGVDGSAAGASAIEFAFAEASLRGAGLRAVHAWNRPVGGPFQASAEETAEGERRLLAEALAGRGERHPDVKVTEQVERGHPVEVLKNASAHADLLVVGSRGRGNLAGLLLGSVSHSLLQHAACPLVVTPATAAPRRA